MHGEHHVGTRLEVTMLSADVVAAQGDVGGLDSDLAALRHGVLRIDNEVHDDLFDLTGVGACSSQIGCQLGLQLNSFADERLQGALHIGDNAIHIHDLQFEQLFTTESQQLASQGCRSLGCLVNGFDLAIHRTAFAGVFEQDFRVSADHHQQIIEVVRDATGQPADGFHLLRLPELVFENTLFSHILGNHFQNFYGLLGGLYQAPAQPYRDDLAVFSLPPDLGV